MACMVCAVLGELIPEPKPRSKAWLSTSFPLDSDAAAAAACGPDYHVLARLKHLSAASDSMVSFVQAQ